MRARPIPATLQPLENRTLLSFTPAYAAQFATDGNFNPAAVATDPQGNVYVLGKYAGVADFNPARNKVFTRDSAVGSIFVAKYSPAGQFLLLSTFGRFDTVGESIAVDATGNIFVTGTFASTTDFNPDLASTTTLTPTGGLDAFLLKLNANGSYAYAKQIGGAADEDVTGLAVDAVGNACVTGNSAGAHTSAFLSRYNAAGTSIFADTFASGSGNVSFSALAVDAAGNMTLAGNSTVAGIDLDPSAAAHPLAAPARFLLKLTSANAFAWLAPLAPTGVDFTHLALDNAGNVYAAGQFSGTIDFNPSPRKTYALASAGGTDAVLARFNAGGDFAYARPISGAGNEQSDGIAVNPTNGDVLVTGRFEGKAYFNPNVSRYRLYSAGSSDVFLARFTAAAGLFQEAAQFGNADPDGPAHLAAGPANATYLTGSLTGAGLVDFNPNEGAMRLRNSQPTDTDGYLVKLLQS